MLPRGAVLATCCCCSLATSNSGDCCRRTKSFPQLFFAVFIFFFFISHFSFDEQLSSLSWLSKWRFILLAIFLRRHALFAFGAASCCCWLVLSLHLWLKLRLHWRPHCIHCVPLPCPYRLSPAQRVVHYQCISRWMLMFMMSFITTKDKWSKLQWSVA